MTPGTDAPLAIRPLGPDTLADWLGFFDHEAFADHPEWGFCYCQYLHVDHAQVDWPSRTAAQNRRAACDRVAGGRLQGLLAYRDGRVVGWCNAAPRPLFEALADEPEPEAARIGVIGCFVVAASQRRRGVARALLDAACVALRAQGLAWAEAMPGEHAATVAAMHHGPLAMYLAAGFTVHRRDADGRVIVRRALAD